MIFHGVKLFGRSKLINTIDHGEMIGNSIDGINIPRNMCISQERMKFVNGEKRLVKFNSVKGSHNLEWRERKMNFGST